MIPKLILENLQFNNGDVISLQDNSITIFVGANNVGKTAALKNIYNLSHQGSHNVTHKVIVASQIKKVGSKEDLVDFLTRTEHKTENHPNFNFYVGGVTYDINNVGDAWIKRPGKDFGNYFIKFMLTENRIGHSNATGNMDFYREQPNHPIQKMYLNSDLENQISSYFKQAFNTDLIVDRFGGNTIYLKVGERPTLVGDENHLSRSYNERIRSLELLSDQGDGMRSFVSILLEMISENNSSLLIDEPEAFLHPPQARFLGKLIGKLFNERQIFISTHSSDFIKGVLESNNQNVNLIRISRNDQTNTTALLSNEEIKEIWKDPILRYSPIIDGLFHGTVIVCESDGDCRFFTAILDAQFENDTRYYKISDTLFIPAHGKAKIPSIVRALKNISVPTYSICDFDIFNNISPLKDLVEAHGGDWSLIEGQWRIFYNEINQLKSQLNKEEAKKGMTEVFDKVTTPNLNSKDIDRIKDILKISTAWSFAKKGGLSFVPAGSAHAACLKVIYDLNKIGIYPLLVGELESFEKSIGGNKARWLEDVLQLDLKNSDVLKQAKIFNKDLVEGIFGHGKM